MNVAINLQSRPSPLIWEQRDEAPANAVKWEDGTVLKAEDGTVVEVEEE